jgi:nitrate/TMAO reductase-like tetraheme cytochrome c subunit
MMRGRAAVHLGYIRAHMMGRRGWVAVLVMGAACSPGPAPTKPPAAHPYFPIGMGDVHALGTVTSSDGTLTCQKCHAVDDTNFGQFECTNCHEHSADRVAPLHAGVAGFSYGPQTCWTCHPDARIHPSPSDPLEDVHVTAQIPAWSGPTIVSVTPQDETLPMIMNHGSAQIPEALKQDCATCHRNASQLLFYPGQFHATLLSMELPQPAVCSDCHAQAFPRGFVGPVSPLRNPPTGQMHHDAVAWAMGAPTSTPAFDADCSACHVPPTKSSAALWATNTPFHDSMPLEPTSCIDCHANTRPGVIDSTDAGLPLNVKIDHGGPVWLGDCAPCHAAGFSSWRGGRFHLNGQPAPATCLPCHALERPTSGATPNPPFDFAVDGGVPHGDAQDCVLCHSNTATWEGGGFSHGPATPADSTCVACHSTQRPATVVSGFDHSKDGTGDCFGCHQATAQHAQLSDWAGGQTYPGNFLISSADQFVVVTETTLKHGAPPNNLVIFTSSIQATLYNAMLHTSSVLPPGLTGGPPPGDMTTCVHCHKPTGFAGGQLHASLTDAGLPQPVSQCTDCHSNMRPAGIVMSGDLQPMDHHATVMTASGATDLSTLDCWTCHRSPGQTWHDGTFHDRVSVTAADCTVCHYPLMADAQKVDVISTASQSYAMKHRSAELKFQSCDKCHTSALMKATTPAASSFNPGQLHANVSPQPGHCIDCHAGVSVPAGVTDSAVTYQGDPQHMNHAVAVVAALDCAVCHAADASPSSGGWSKSTRFHPHATPQSCTPCHAQNLPSAIVSSSTVTSADAASGVSGQHDQISHADVNAAAHDCSFCHTGVGDDWSLASFHINFTGGSALVMNGTTGRCSNCHLNVRPTSAFTAQDHSGFTATSATDCSSCHQWPGTGSTSTPNWHRQVGPPPNISVGGFTVAMPPAANAGTVEPGLNGLAHPTVASGTACTTCHTSSSGGRGAFGYDHSGAPSSGCASCHEAGSDLLGTPWTLNAPNAAMTSATCNEGGGAILDRGGDTRPVGVASLACSAAASSQTCGSQNCSLNHFYPSDCSECHAKPAAVPALDATGTTYTGNWKFQHYFGAPATQSTCCHCHAAPSCRG